MDWEHLLSTVLGVLWWPPSPACLGVGNKAAKTSLQLSFTSAVQTRNCPSRKPTLWILWHFPPSNSDTFSRAFSKGQRQHIWQTSVLPALPLWAGTAVTQEQGHFGKEALRDLRELWQIMVSRLSRRFHLKLIRHWDHALPEPGLWMQSAPGSAELYFSCLFGQIMETGIKDEGQDSQIWAVS